MASLAFTIGRLYVRSVRRALRAEGMSFTEDKGWLDSQFVVTGTNAEILRLQSALRRWAKEVA